MTSTTQSHDVMDSIRCVGASAGGGVSLAGGPGEARSAPRTTSCGRLNRFLLGQHTQQLEAAMELLSQEAVLKRSFLCNNLDTSAAPQHVTATATTRFWTALVSMVIQTPPSSSLSPVIGSSSRASILSSCRKQEYMKT
ncbi:hypothetical protein EYF80_060800 [Liparis tanakae]|uniref:Uncharacterized protein n=1 Tax=Liparis tanakae TaxID=230148 RepID=A0A4Z2EL08_9TELE|nr:hypothetical protein EYF80_060800 [Liparis tanakae]